MTEQILDKPTCPKCKTKDRVMKTGFYKNGSQKFFCQDCKKTFLRPEDYKPKLGKHKLPFLDSASLLKCHAQSKANLNIDSIFGVPCFLCPTQVQCINPNNCLKLETWLND